MLRAAEQYYPLPFLPVEKTAKVKTRPLFPRKTRTGFGLKKRVILGAYGISVDGKREFIDFIVAKNESEQRCWAHKIRNVSNYLRRKYQDRCISEARGIYNADSRKE